MDKLCMMLNKKGAQSTVSLPSYYKKSSSTSQGRKSQNIEQLAEQLRQTKKEKLKSGRQVGGVPQKVEIKYNTSENEDVQDPTQIKYDAKLKIGNGKDDCENIINQAYSKGIVAESDQASYLKNCETKGAKTVTIMNVLSTQGDSSSNGTVANERNRSGVIKTKSNSMSSGSDERNTQKQSIMPAKDTIDSDENKQQEYCQRIKMKSDHSRNLDNHQNNHYQYKIYSSGEREGEEVPGNYLAKTSEKIKSSSKGKVIASTGEQSKFTNLNQNNFKKIIFKNSNKSRGRSDKSGPLSNRNSSGDVPPTGNNQASDPKLK